MGVRYRQQISSAQGISQGLNDSNDVVILSDSLSTPPDAPAAAITPTKATSEGMRGGSPTVGVFIRSKTNMIGADDSDEEGDDGDDLTLSTLATKGISISEPKASAPAMKINRNSKGGAGKGKAKIFAHLEPQIIAELEESFISVPTEKYMPMKRHLEVLEGLLGEMRATWLATRDSPPEPENPTPILRLDWSVHENLSVLRFVTCGVLFDLYRGILLPMDQMKLTMSAPPNGISWDQIPYGQIFNGLSHQVANLCHHASKAEEKAKEARPGCESCRRSTRCCMLKIKTIRSRLLRAGGARLGKEGANGYQGQVLQQIQ
ncbi:UNVERIFIED_CONTAM: hypothetical protein Slati_0902900 [Sesamum latifolium]|uniref:Uncharacterized protein n=1 Tax=Sesamum latifolium TaxID=2727402 RepID=A0AAW2XNC0_9LAMI